MRRMPLLALSKSNLLFIVSNYQNVYAIPSNPAVKTFTFFKIEDGVVFYVPRKSDQMRLRPILVPGMGRSITQGRI